MPRLPTRLIHRARNIDTLLPLLLRACRDLPSARNELRWLREHVNALPLPTTPGRNKRPTLLRLCRERSTGYPLQYILGTQPFGDLEILCEPGVLIPRPETERYASHLADLLEHNLPSDAARLRILDVCSGTGCLALLLLQRLSSRVPRLEVLGLDIEPRAIALARENVRHNVELDHLRDDAARMIHFEELDILKMPTIGGAAQLRQHWDILVSNPPYISHREYDTETSKSARNFEPALALKGDAYHGGISERLCNKVSSGDRFYIPILELGYHFKSQIVVLEVGGREQALRVLRQMHSRRPAFFRHWIKAEVWNDDPQVHRIETEYVHAGRVNDGGENAPLTVLRRGQGIARSLVLSTDVGSTWLGRSGT